MNNCFRTDLAKEALLHHSGALEGVAEQTETRGGVMISRVRVQTREAAEKLQKRIGLYVTLEPQKSVSDAAQAVTDAIAAELSDMLPRACRHILVVGLGNRAVTPDALGPRTAERIFVTRHISRFLPELAPHGMRQVSALIPGVLGITGMETSEILRGVISAVKPDALLCIDALAADTPMHIGRTVQLNDNGLLPGAGVGNRQQELHAEALGLPVLAIGVPTVAFAASIARETARAMAVESGDAKNADALSAFGEQAAQKRIGDLIVTTKDVDALITDAARRLGNGINRALHGAQYGDLEALLLQ